LNNSEQSQTAAIPTYISNGGFERIYGSGPDTVTSAADRNLSLTVPALSTVVYESVDRIARSGSAPSISLNSPAVTAETNFADARVGQCWRFLVQRGHLLRQGG
jgi:alpha-amylase